jgi:hypothetical protein
MHIRVRLMLQGKQFTYNKPCNIQMLIEWGIANDNYVYSGVLKMTTSPKVNLRRRNTWENELFTSRTNKWNKLKD